MFERSWTVNNTNADPATIVLDGLALPAGDPKLEVSAWQSSTVALPVLVLEGTVPLATAQYQTSTPGPVDAILAVPANGGVARCRFSNDIRTLTLFFPQAVPAGDEQYVTVKVREVKHYEG